MFAMPNSKFGYVKILAIDIKLYVSNKGKLKSSKNIMLV
jgi:hypothetical protein